MAFCHPEPEVKDLGRERSALLLSSDGRTLVPAQHNTCAAPVSPAGVIYMQSYDFPLLECHGRFIRADRGPLVAYLVSVRTAAALANVVSIRAVVGRGGDAGTVTINSDVY